MAPRTQQQKPVSTLPKCAASTFVCLSLSSSFLQSWKKEQSLCRHRVKPLVSSTCARAQSALYLFKFANKGCYCDSWTKGAIKISETLAPFPASWVASLSPLYLGILPAPSWFCPLQSRAELLGSPGLEFNISSLPDLISMRFRQSCSIQSPGLRLVWGSLIPVSGHCATKEKAGGEIIWHCSFLRETMTAGSQVKWHQLTKLLWKVHIDILVKLHPHELVFLLLEQLYGAQ